LWRINLGVAGLTVKQNPKFELGFKCAWQAQSFAAVGSEKFGDPMFWNALLEALFDRFGIKSQDPYYDGFPSLFRSRCTSIL
jgi:hypothetical protein